MDRVRQHAAQASAAVIMQPDVSSHVGISQLLASCTANQRAAQLHSCPVSAAGGVPFSDLMSAEMLDVNAAQQLASCHHEYCQSRLPCYLYKMFGMAVAGHPGMLLLLLLPYLPCTWWLAARRRLAAMV
jgi:hypothetical protein